MPKKKIIKKTIFILLFVLVAFGVVLAILKSNIYAKIAQKNYGYEIMGVYRDPQLEYEESKELEYKNISLLQSFTGELPVSFTTSTIKEIFLKKIPAVLEKVENLSVNDLAEYYSKNSYSIRRNLRIESEESFANMIEKFNDIICNLKKDYKTCEFIKENDNIKINFIYETTENIECYIIRK